MRLLARSAETGTLEDTGCGSLLLSWCVSRTGQHGAGRDRSTCLKGPQWRDGLYRTMANMVGSMQRNSMNSSMAR